MANLLGQSFLVLCVTLVVAGEYDEFGCKYNDDRFNYNENSPDFGDRVNSIRFKSRAEFIKFVHVVEWVRNDIRFKTLYNTIDPFFRMYNSYKTVKKTNNATKFVDFFSTYNPNPYNDRYSRFAHDSPFPVIDIYQAMKVRFSRVYPTFKDSFFLATCDETIDKAVLENIQPGKRYFTTPEGFVHDRVVGVIQFVVDGKDGAADERGFVIVESTHLTSSRTQVPIVMVSNDIRHDLDRNEVQLFGPTAARYNWLRGTSESFVRIDYMEYECNSTIEDGMFSLGAGKEKVTQTDLLFMIPRSLCSFIKHVWKSQLLDPSVRLLKDTAEEIGDTRYYFAIEIELLAQSDTLFTWWDWFWTFMYRRPKDDTFVLDDHPLLTKYVHPNDISTVLQAFPLDELNKLNQTFKDSLIVWSAGFNIKDTEMYDILQQMINIQKTDKEFLVEFINYKKPVVNISTFWNVAGNLAGNILNRVQSATGTARTFLPYGPTGVPIKVTYT